MNYICLLCFDTGVVANQIDPNDKPDFDECSCGLIAIPNAESEYLNRAPDNQQDAEIL